MLEQARGRLLCENRGLEPAFLFREVRLGELVLLFVVILIQEARTLEFPSIGDGVLEIRELGGGLGGVELGGLGESEGVVAAEGEVAAGVFVGLGVDVGEKVGGDGLLHFILI